MPTQVQFRRGTTAQNNNFVGAAGELSIDLTRGTIRVHDGATLGGTELVTVAGTSSFATNIVGGAAGSIPYQTAPGATDYIGIGAANTVLVSDGSTATWQSLGSLTSIGGVNADNILVSSATAGERYLVFVDAFGSYTGPEASTSLKFATTSGLTINTATTVGGSILPDTDGVYNLGSPSKKFNKLYLTSATLYLDTLELSGLNNTLTVNGVQVVTTATLTALSANTATNVAGGTAGQVPYQTGPGLTSFFGPGTAGQILVSAGSSAPVYTNTASIYVGDAVNAEKWKTARTLTLAGDLTGSVSIDGSTGITLTATIAADSIALGTDTTGNYVAGVSAGTAIGVSGSGSEGATVTIDNLGVTALAAGTGIATSGSTGSLTVTNVGVTSIAGTAPITLSGSTGSVTVSLNTGSTYVANSVNAEKWQTARTITLGGDLSGSISIDGSANVTLTATVVADSVALGTDTTGDYVATGATVGYGISGSTAGETTTFTVTSNATSTNAASTIVFRNSTNGFDVGNINVKDTTAASSTSTGALKVEGGVGIGGNLYVGGEIVAQKLTIEFTTVTTTLVQTDDVITTNNATQASSTTTGAIVATGGIGIGKDLRVGGSVFVSGNQTVTGTVTHGGLVFTSGTGIDQLSTASVLLTLTTDWQSTGINGTDLATGSYYVQVTANDSGQGGGQVNMYYTGLMSWFSGATGENATNEIALTRAGAGSGNGAIYLRTRSTNGGDLVLEIAGLTNNSAASTYNFSFRRII